MYVIFPADDLIYMTYGAAVPRFKPRPTLDNLREPAVPLGSRSSRNAYKGSNEYLAVNNNLPNNPSPTPSANSFYQNYLGDPYESVGTTGLDNGRNYPPRDSPSIYLEPSSASLTSGQPIPTASPKSTKSNIFRPKLALNLSRLNRNKPSETNEQASSRLSEVHDIKVSNPTFTHENLRQRNYDAFFQSGEPVYSLATRAKPPRSTTPEPDFQQSRAVTPNLSYRPPLSQPPSQIDPPRPRTIPDRIQPEPQQIEPVRSHSVDPTDSVLKVSQKGTPSPLPSPRPTYRSLFGARDRRRRGFSLSPLRLIKNMAASTTGVLKDYTQQNLNETLKSHNNVSFKLIKTASEFTDSLAHIYDQHAEALQNLVATFRKRNGELRKERPVCHSTLFQAWETFLQETEADSQTAIDIASSLSRQVSRPMVERSFHRKVQSRKVFTHRESFDTIIAKTEEKLSKSRLEYKQCYILHRQNPTQQSLVNYIDAHNAYVQQLHATNAMLETYNLETLPQLISELEDVYHDLCNIVADGLLVGADIISTKAMEQSKRYDNVLSQCRNVSSSQDLNNFARILPQPSNPGKVPRKPFAPPVPQPGDIDGGADYNDINTPALKNELIIERGDSLQVRPTIEALKREAVELESQIRQLQDSIDVLVRTQLRGIENQLFNKVNEMQEDVSMKKFDLRAKQIHLAAVRAQRDLFLEKIEQPGSPKVERKLSTSSSTSMKTKWLKAFRSLKPAGSGANEKKNVPSGGAIVRISDNDTHNLQEYTYKKITPCDVCSQVLRGHTRQGLRCRICKMNVHADCATNLPKCQAKQKLLRRQKSTSEIENRIDPDEEKPNDIDQIYQVLKQAGEISNQKQSERGGANLNGSNGCTDDPNDLQSGGCGVTGLNKHIQDIPILNVPGYPDRKTIRPLRGALKPSNVGPQQNQGLTAPTVADISNSGGVPIMVNQHSQQPPLADPGTRRRLFAGFRPLSAFSRSRMMRSTQHRSISLPETEERTRPFGQPLCLVAEVKLDMYPELVARGARRKR